MTAQINDYDSWDEYQEFPYVNKVKFRNYIKRVRENFLKMSEGFGDVNLSRQ